MANIQMTDRNPSELGIMEEVEELTSEKLLDEELTNKELEAINGGSCGCCPQEQVWTVGPSKQGDDPYNPPRTSAWSGAYRLDGKP